MQGLLARTGITPVRRLAYISPQVYMSAIVNARAIYNAGIKPEDRLQAKGRHQL